VPIYSGILIGGLVLSGQNKKKNESLVHHAQFLQDYVPTSL
jgi:hypothetical protein